MTEGEEYDEPETEVDVRAPALVATEAWSPEVRRGRLWFMAGVVVCLVGIVFGPLALLGIGTITADDADTLILRLWTVLSAPIALVAGYLFLDATRHRGSGPHRCPWCGR